MKTGALVLSFYIFALSLLPCGECLVEIAGVFDADSREAVSSLLDVGDECVPFCALSCCGVAVSENRSELPFSRVSRGERPSPVVSSYHSRYTRLHASLIWQPPKA